jgi:hypothetical protein
MKMLKDVYGAYNIVKFWVIVIAISGFSAICLPAGLNEVTSSAVKGDALWISVFLIGLTAFGIFIFPFALWQHIARKRFFNWLESQWSNLEAGATHPAGYTITYDTPLVRYEVVFSVILATVSFTSRPYVLNHPTTKIVRVSYTLFSLIFGWWFLAGFDGVVGTVKALAGNINQKSFTIKQLLSQTNTSLPMK